MVGFEALLRWDHPQHGTIAPPEIIDVACEVGVVRQLTKNVFFNCCEMIDKLTESGRCDLTVAMNLSPREMAGGRIPHEILSQMERRDLPVSMLEIEITEEAPFDQRGMNDSLDALSNAGVSIALDDFGTGFATFASLKKGLVDKIKIDQVFVRGIAESEGDQHIVRAMVALADALGVKVTAEGIETEEDRDMLCALGCSSGQGFLFAPPCRWAWRSQPCPVERRFKGRSGCPVAGADSPSRSRPGRKWGLEVGAGHDRADSVFPGGKSLRKERRIGVFIANRMVDDILAVALLDGIVVERFAFPGSMVLLKRS